MFVHRVNMQIKAHKQIAKIVRRVPTKIWMGKHIAKLAQRVPTKIKWVSRLANHVLVENTVVEQEQVH